jgi:hypothetical protein
MRMASAFGLGFAAGLAVASGTVFSAMSLFSLDAAVTAMEARAKVQLSALDALALGNTAVARAVLEADLQGTLIGLDPQDSWLTDSQKAAANEIHEHASRLGLKDSGSYE